MFGGIAVAGNVLCLVHTEARAKVFLIDLEERRLISLWEYSGSGGGYADAGGVAIAADYSILVADSRNDLVRRFTAFGKEVGRLGRRSERPPGAACRDRKGVLDRPRAVAMFDGIAHVACGERRLVRGVQRFYLDGRALAPLRSCGDSEGRFGAPRGLHAGPAGVLVADTLHGAIQRFGRRGQFVSRFSTAHGDDEASRPVAVLPVGDGDVLVADHGDVLAIKRFGLDGTRRPAPSSSAALEEPIGLAGDEHGRVYVLDRGGERVLRLRPDLHLDGQIVDLAEILRGG